MSSSAVDPDAPDEGVLTEAQRARRGWTAGTLAVVSGFAMVVPTTLMLPVLLEGATQVDGQALLVEACAWVALGFAMTFSGLWAAGRRDGRPLLVVAGLATVVLLLSSLLNGAMVLLGVPPELDADNIVTLPGWFITTTRVGPCVGYSPLPLIVLVAAVSLLRR